MSKKTCRTSKISFNRLHGYSKTTNSLVSDKSTKPGSSKNNTSSTKSTSQTDGKSCSAGIINCYKKPPIVKPKKTTKSEVCCNRKFILKKSVDFCKKCGDVCEPPNKTTVSKTKAGTETPTDLAALQRDIYLTEKLEQILEKVQSIPNDIGLNNPIGIQEKETKPQNVKNKDPVEQYYKNENFRQISESAHAIENVLKKISSLDTIKELPEVPTLVESQKSSHSKGINIYYDSEEDYDSIKQLREFRKNNYFECHSSKSRIDSKACTTALNDHKCVYRFYLNDRLFPVPLHADRHENIRCVECNLPIDLQKRKSKDSINGTIQAKVKLDSGNDTQDMLLMLPVRDTMIIKEKRKEKKKVEEDVMYFGVIKLNSSGYSVFNQNLPSDSLALKYQKGFQEYDNSKGYIYETVNEDDIIEI